MRRCWIGRLIVRILTQSKIFKESCRETSQQFVGKKKAITKDSFREIIQKEWNGVETETFVNLARSMPRRLEKGMVIR